MPIGTEILAAREGIVVKVIQNNNQNCPDKSCASYNNYILIYHNNGTFSNYVHLKQNGVLTKINTPFLQQKIILQAFS